MSSLLEQPDSAVEGTAHLRRVLGRRDLVLLFVVAVVNLNVIPSITSNGGITVWLWLLALVFFFWPQGIAVIELSQRFPGEGGIYLWSKKYFGNFHGFLSGWCYWTNNVFYIPTVLLYLVGTAVYLFGARGQALANDPHFTFVAALIALVLVVVLNVLGLGVGKWINNLGGIGTAVAAAVLIGLGITVAVTHGTPLHASDFKVAGANLRLVSAFGTICFGLVGLELASVMGDEIRDPKRELPPAVAVGGVVSGLLYIGVTLTVLIAVPREQIGVLQGVLQAVSNMAAIVGIPWIVPIVTLVLTISIAGIASAWLAGSARIPFVAGLDSYMPAALGKTHPKTGAPYVALIVQGIVSVLFLAMSFAGAKVKEAFDLLLALAVVLQLVPFLYLYAALLKIAFGAERSVRYKKMTLLLAGASGLLTTAIGMVVAFIPPADIKDTHGELVFIGKMIFGTLFFVGLSLFFYFVYGGKRRLKNVAA